MIVAAAFSLILRFQSAPNFQINPFVAVFFRNNTRL